MVSTTMLLQVLCLMLYIQGAWGNAASDTDISATFPENWCDTRYGTPTRTTGECICKSLCNGPDCINQHGLSFYAYTNCLTCTCSKPSKSEHAVLVREIVPESQETHEEEEENFAVRSTRQKSGRADYDNMENSEGDLFSYADWYEDNGRTVFAVCITCLLLSFFVMLLFIKT